MITCGSAATGRCDLYADRSRLVGSRTIVRGEPLGFRNDGGEGVAVARPYEIPLPEGNYRGTVTEAHSPQLELPRRFGSDGGNIECASRDRERARVGRKNFCFPRRHFPLSSALTFCEHRAGVSAISASPREKPGLRVGAALRLRDHSWATRASRSGSAFLVQVIYLSVVTYVSVGRVGLATDAARGATPGGAPHGLPHEGRRQVWADHGLVE